MDHLGNLLVKLKYRWNCLRRRVQPYFNYDYDRCLNLILIGGGIQLLAGHKPWKRNGLILYRLLGFYQLIMAFVKIGFGIVEQDDLVGLGASLLLVLSLLKASAYVGNIQLVQPIVSLVYAIVYFSSLSSVSILVFLIIRAETSVMTLIMVGSSCLIIVECYYWCHLVESIEKIMETIAGSVAQLAFRLEHSVENHSEYVQMRTSLMIIQVNASQRGRFSCGGVFPISIESFADLCFVIYRFATFLLESGYSYPVDWWSLGIVAYEMRSGVRPFVVHSATPLVEVKNILITQPLFPRHWSDNFIDLLTKLLNVHPGPRISSQRELQQTKLLRGTNFERILAKQTNPLFKPSKDHLNCDPSLELEEMIIEAKPLHKKKKRLAKQRSINRDGQNPNQDQLSPLDSQLLKEFLVYNRFKEQKRKAMEQKETEWQQELDQAMASSDVEGTTPVSKSESVGTRLATISEGTVPEQGENGVNENGDAKRDPAQQADSLDYIDRTPSPKPSI